MPYLARFLVRRGCSGRCKIREAKIIERGSGAVRTRMVYNRFPMRSPKFHNSAAKLPMVLESSFDVVILVVDKTDSQLLETLRRRKTHTNLELLRGSIESTILPSIPWHCCNRLDGRKLDDTSIAVMTLRTTEYLSASPEYSVEGE